MINTNQGACAAHQDALPRQPVSLACVRSKFHVEAQSALADTELVATTAPGGASPCTAEKVNSRKSVKKVLKIHPEFIATCYQYPGRDSVDRERRASVVPDKEKGEGMFPRFLALVSETASISNKRLARVAAALNKQATRDITPFWGVQATVDAFIDLEDVPLGYWPMVVLDNIGVPGAAGIHLDQDGQPFALIQHSNSWSLTASHEAVEMMVDPFGDRLIAGP